MLVVKDSTDAFLAHYCDGQMQLDNVLESSTEKNQAFTTASIEN